MACSDEFKEAVEKAGLTGFVFDKLSDEIVETRAPKGSIKKEKVICQKNEEPYQIYLSNTRELVRIRPSKRSKKIPSFCYVDKKVLKDYFVQAEPDEKCCICGKEDVIFYAGYAYENGKCIVFSADQERFCSDCLVTGRAAKERNIVFNSGLIEGFSDMQEEKKQTLLYSTPGVRYNFDTNEELWPVCCDDFCCYMGKSRYSSKFQCMKCGNKIVWEDFT